MDYEGVDFDDEAVNYARREFGLKNIFKDDLFKFLNSRPDNNYDIITAFNIIEHIKKDYEIGKQIIAVHLSFLKAVANGEVASKLASIENE